MEFIWRVWLKRNTTGSTGCQLGLFISNWTHSDWQLWLAGLSAGVFPPLAALFPYEAKGQTSTSFPGCKARSGGHMWLQGETFMEPSSFLATSSWTNFHCLPSPSNCPNTLEITASLFAANWEIWFHCINCQKTKHTFLGGRIFLSHYSQSAVTDLVRCRAKVSLWTPHVGSISIGSTDTLLHFCLGWTLATTTGLWLVSPTHSSHFSWISVLPSVLLMQSHQQSQLLQFCFVAWRALNHPHIKAL